MKLCITRLAPDRFSVKTDTVLTDGTFRADNWMKLANNQLRSHEAQGWMRIGGLMTVNLGPVSFTRVNSLAIGQSVQF